MKRMAMRIFAPIYAPLANLGLRDCLGNFRGIIQGINFSLRRSINLF